MSCLYFEVIMMSLPTEAPSGDGILSKKRDITML